MSKGATTSSSEVFERVKNNPALQPVFTELNRSGKFWLSYDHRFIRTRFTEATPRDQMIGAYALDEHKEPDVVIHAIFINPLESNRWGIAATATAAGEFLEVYYTTTCGREFAKRMNGTETSWPGLDAALTKARLFVEMGQA